MREVVDPTAVVVFNTHMSTHEGNGVLPVLVDVDEIAALIRVDKQTVYRLRRRGEIPAYRVGGQYRFNADEVLSALKERAA